MLAFNYTGPKLMKIDTQNKLNTIEHYWTLLNTIHIWHIYYDLNM